MHREHTYTHTFAFIYRDYTIHLVVTTKENKGRGTLINDVTQWGGGGGGLHNGQFYEKSRRINFTGPKFLSISFD